METLLLDWIIDAFLKSVPDGLLELVRLGDVLVKFRLMNHLVLFYFKVVPNLFIKRNVLLLSLPKLDPKLFSMVLLLLAVGSLQTGSDQISGLLIGQFRCSNSASYQVISLASGTIGFVLALRRFVVTASWLREFPCDVSQLLRDHCLKFSFLEPHVAEVVRLRTAFIWLRVFVTTLRFAVIASSALVSRSMILIHK